MPSSATRGDASTSVIYTVFLSAATGAAALGAVANALLLRGPAFYTALALLAGILFGSGLIAVRTAAARPERLAPIGRSIAVALVALYEVLLWHATYQYLPGGASDPAGPYAIVAYLWFPFVAIYLFVAFRDRAAVRYAYGALAISIGILLPSVLQLVDPGRPGAGGPVAVEVAVPLHFVAASGVLVAVLYVFAGFIRRLQHAEVTAAAMRRIANTDVLTGLANRRRMEVLLVQELRRSQRYERPLSLLLIDVDDFKRLNDTYGHQTGDRVLIGLARDLRDSLRVSDHLGRWGGEEFLIITPETDRDNAAKLAEAVRSHVSSETIGDPLDDYRVTVSVGVASYRDGDRLEDMLGRADDALYRAKRGGRDRVRIEGQSTHASSAG